MNNILKNVCSAQKLHGAEHAGSMEQREMEERNSRYRCLKMKAAAAWALAVLLSLLSVFGGEHKTPALRKNPWNEYAGKLFRYPQRQ